MLFAFNLVMYLKEFIIFNFNVIKIQDKKKEFVDTSVTKRLADFKAVEINSFKSRIVVIICCFFFLNWYLKVID